MNLRHKIHKKRAGKGLIWQSPCRIKLFCHTDLSCHTETLHSKVKYLKILVILSLWRSIHKFKVWICTFKAWIFRFVLTHSAQNDNVLPSLQVDFSPFYKRLKMTKKNKTQMTAHCLFDENKLTAKKSFIPAKPLEFSKETKAVLWLFAWVNLRASGANKFVVFVNLCKIKPKNAKIHFFGVKCGLVLAQIFELKLNLRSWWNGRHATFRR